jgi:DNA-directed RNA polymerase specialized sigma24 family protein
MALHKHVAVAATPIHLISILVGVSVTAEEVDVTHLREALVTSSLSERQKQAVLLRFFMGLTYQQMGRAMGVCAGPAQQHTLNAIHRLRHPINMRHLSRAVIMSAHAGEEQRKKIWH